MVGITKLYISYKVDLSCIVFYLRLTDMLVNISLQLLLLLSESNIFWNPWPWLPCFAYGDL